MTRLDAWEIGGIRSVTSIGDSDDQGVEEREEVGLEMFSEEEEKINKKDELN